MSQSSSETAITIASTGAIVFETIAATGVYEITSAGASGGNGQNAGGAGAVVTDAFTLAKGTVLEILAGAAGANSSTSGGGGGGTFVYEEPSGNTGGAVLNRAGTLLEVAGGGGGGGSLTGGNALSGTGGNGGGGIAGDENGYLAGGGGGYSGNGEDGGASFQNGGAGGSGAYVYGGFGGGGGADGSFEGGGGGGYSGGNGGFGGGGGGSYDVNTAGSGRPILNNAGGIIADNTGNGMVEINALVSEINTQVLYTVNPGYGLYANSLTITNTGAVLPAATGAIGVSIASGDSVLNFGSITGGPGGAGVYLNGGTFVNDGFVSGDGGNAVQFRLNVSELVLDSASTISGAIAGFAMGDTIVSDGFVAVSETFTPRIGLILTDAGGNTETLYLTGSLDTGNFTISTDGANTTITAGEDLPVCYLRGTRILTPAGEKTIESLNTGDAVVTKFGGYQRIKWIGRQSYARRFIAHNFEQIPVRIMKDALGPNLPKRDLFVSSGHSMLIDVVLILAKSLVNGITILQDECPEQVDYFQLEFETHDCVLAEGAWSESYADTPDWRNKFHNAAEFSALYPNHIAPSEQILCAPRPLAGPGLDAALRPIIAALNPRPGALHGCIDEISPAGLIRGWAWDEANPQLPVLLEITVKNRVLGTVLACDYRRDLEAAGIGRGRAAFSFTAPAGLPALPHANIQIRRASDGAQIRISEPFPAAAGLKAA